MTIIAGQPLDLQTIIAAIDRINNLEAELGKKKNQSTIIGQDKVVNTYPTSGLSIEAASVSLDKVEVRAGDQAEFRHTFNTKYSKPPVVTATLFNTAGSTVVQDHSVVITNIATDKVSGYIKFQASGGIANTTVNIVAVGLATGD